jgi:hypothetical protein
LRHQGSCICFFQFQKTHHKEDRFRGQLKENKSKKEGKRRGFGVKLLQRGGKNLFNPGCFPAISK